MNYMFKLRLYSLEQYVQKFRIQVGNMRQRRQSMEYDVKAIKMQRLCGEIEQTLYRCRQLCQ